MDDEYQKRRDQLGWRLLTCPLANIDTAKTALIAINPGGDQFLEPMPSVEDDSAYETEGWKEMPAGEERLQRQVRRMLELADEKPAEVLSGYLAPFRSKRWADLPRRRDALTFGRAIWTDLLHASVATRIFCFGKDVARHLLAIEPESS